MPFFKNAKKDVIYFIWKNDTFKKGPFCDPLFWPLKTRNCMGNAWEMARFRGNPGKFRGNPGKSP